MRTILLLLSLLLLAVPAPAADDLVVTDTNPANGEGNVSPLLTEITITFSAPVRTDSFSFVQVEGFPFPELTGDPHFPDNVTCILPVALGPETTYGVGVNSPTHGGFRSPTDPGVICVPYVFTFATGTEESSSPGDVTATIPRVALVIGNSDYPEAPLRNPANDARDMAQSLEALGFTVIHLENADKRAMVEAIRDFSKRAFEGVALFYYAGHGLQVDGINYLVPLNTDIESEADVEFEAVSADFILAQMEQAEAFLNVIILDACRNNPFTRSFRSDSRGLAFQAAPQGSIIAFATSPGSVAADGEGDNGLYTAELLKLLPSPGLSIEDLFKEVGRAVSQETGDEQRPWVSSDFYGDFSFSPAQ